MRAPRIQVIHEHNKNWWQKFSAFLETRRIYISTGRNRKMTRCLEALQRVTPAFCEGQAFSKILLTRFLFGSILTSCQSMYNMNRVIWYSDRPSSVHTGVDSERTKHCETSFLTISISRDINDRFDCTSIMILPTPVCTAHHSHKDVRINQSLPFSLLWCCGIN